VLGDQVQIQLAGQQRPRMREPRVGRGAQTGRSMLALHLLQSALVHINTPLLQAVLEDPRFNHMVGETEWRALSPLFWSNINPYGQFRLDMTTRLDLTRERVAA
jgi:hypothetical protein